MNPDLDKLHAYPFEKLVKLKQDIKANQDLSAIALSIGEPKHAPPAQVIDTLSQSLSRVSTYPTTLGLPELRQAIADWLVKRYRLDSNSLAVDKHILPVNGTREALFAFAQAVVDRSQNALVVVPNPFYQIYEGAALLAGAEPLYLNSREQNNYCLDLSEITDSQWQRCQLFYICSPNNPTGAVFSLDDYQQLIALADRYHFIIASDECYSEIYPHEHAPPPGLLEACRAMGRDDYQSCVVFHSLSKRSNLPGLRSGFVAGDQTVIQQFLRYRTYHGCAMAIPTQLASIAAWKDEQHVIDNRQLYREKFNAVAEIVNGSWDLPLPQAGFNFWAKTPIDDQVFCQKLFAREHITVLPGSYLSRTKNGFNPGSQHVRMAMVAPLDECKTAALRLKRFVTELS
ncbi:MAG: succinyldiaminopimelate transaminase [Pseudomonadota bacterium]